MATNKTVVVLAPNGRRQNVKVTPNTTILQVLEEVCSKQGFKPEEYDIRHHNHILDTTALMQFSGLPNNAQLELSTATKIRSESAVILGVQLENGNRLMGNFQPGDSLWSVLTNMCPDDCKPEKNPVLIYMRREIYGQESFKEITLRSLGLTGGRAMLRLIHRNPDVLKTQANVSAPLPSRPSLDVPFKRKLVKVEPEPAIPTSTESRTKYLTNQPLNLMNQIINQTITEVDKQSDSYVHDSSSNNVHKNTEGMDVDEENTDKFGKELNPTPIQTKTSDEEIVFLGERNAIAFSLSMAQSLPHEDLPDEFYDLTINDARTLLQDLKRRRAEMEEAPLQTSEIRSLEQNKKVLRQLNQYKRSVLRIQFPDRTVLQGTFTPLETVAVVMNFVRGYLSNPSLQFHLYTTPPKQILLPTTRLVDADCVPCAVVHFGLAKLEPEDTHYLRPDLVSRFTSFSAASLAASRSRGLMPILHYSGMASSSTTQQPSSFASTSHQGSVSTGATPRFPSQAPSSSTQQDCNTMKNYPKWFRPSK